MRFDLESQAGGRDGGPASCAPRAGVLHTPHGSVETPTFMPVGTQATVKGMTPEALKSIGVDIILSNAYHLYLRPGHELIGQFGGLHGFMGWRGPILTDSGGFQVFSLGGLQRITEQGVVFRSHIDGSEHSWSPEKVMEVEAALGADLIMPLDECLPYPAEREYADRSVDLTARWAERCKEAQLRPGDQALFGIVQGGCFADLRRRSAAQLTALDLPGYAIGGLSVGEPKDLLYEMLEETVPLLPAGRPRYLMGVGTPDLLVEGTRRGVDMFDCVLPTRTARLGTALVPEGRLVLRNAPFARDARPIQEDCDCYACRNFSRGYIRHLIHAKEMLGGQLLTIHNLRYLTRLMSGIREAVKAGTFERFRAEFWTRRGAGQQKDGGILP